MCPSIQLGSQPRSASASPWNFGAPGRQSNLATLASGAYIGRMLSRVRSSRVWPIFVTLAAMKLQLSTPRQLIVAILMIAAAPVCAQAQTPSVPRVSKDDAQKVVRIISGDKAKTQTYCDIQTLGEQMERAYEKRNLKLVDELLQKIETLEKTLGPEYVALVDRLGDIDPEKDKLADEITSVFAPLDRLCRTQRHPLQLTPLTERSSKGNCPLRYCRHTMPL
jgi:hypothetical protein